MNALFCDRDGTIIDDVPYLADPIRCGSAMTPSTSSPGPAAAGLALIVVTNQSGVARGLITPDQLAQVNERSTGGPRATGRELDDVRYCVHGPDDGCSCRKPEPGMILDAARDHQIDLAGSVMVGDADTRRVRRRGGRGRAQLAAA